KTFAEPVREEIAAGRLDVAIVDTALRRVLTQKAQLGLLDEGWSSVPTALAGTEVSDPEAVRGSVDLDSPTNRAIASELAERAIVLLRNEGVLPLQSPRRIAVIGPNADEPLAVLGCYSFPVHIGVKHPDFPVGIELPTLLASVRAEFPDSIVSYAKATSVDGGEMTGFADALEAVRTSDVAILALGDRAGLFGRGTSGEGCDAESLSLPGAQQDLLDAVIATGTPTV